MNQLLIPVEWEMYLTSSNKKLFITLGHDEEKMVYYYLYSFNEIDDCICAGIDMEWMKWKKDEFVKDRNLKLIKKGKFK